jgi:hypothetical protein
MELNLQTLSMSKLLVLILALVIPIPTLASSAAPVSISAEGWTVTRVYDVVALTNCVTSAALIPSRALSGVPHRTCCVAGRMRRPENRTLSGSTCPVNSENHEWRPTRA